MLNSGRVRTVSFTRARLLLFGGNESIPPAGDFSHSPSCLPEPRTPVGAQMGLPASAADRQASTPGRTPQGVQRSSPAFGRERRLAGKTGARLWLSRKGMRVGSRKSQAQASGHVATDPASSEARGAGQGLTRQRAGFRVLPGKAGGRGKRKLRAADHAAVSTGSAPPGRSVPGCPPWRRRRRCCGRGC